MILFWLICAGLVAVALAFILPTLLRRAAAAEPQSNAEANVEVYRDQLSELAADLTSGIVSPEQYRQDRDEIERRLLDDVATRAEAAEKKTQPRAANRTAAYAVALGIPILAITLYLLVGNSAALSGAPARNLPNAALPAGGQMSPQQIEANVASLAKKLEQNPNDAASWAMLGRSYINLEKYPEASNAYQKASALKTGDADLLLEYAFSLAMANGRQLQGRPAELVKQALQIAPENPSALQLAGSVEFEAKNYKQAIVYWQKLLAKTSGDPELTQAITSKLNEAKSLAGAAGK